MIFADRADAGRRLAARLQHVRDERVVVLGLPRGGVPVALEAAHALGTPLDAIVVRKAFLAIRQFHAGFSQTTDDEVAGRLKRAALSPAAAGIAAKADAAVRGGPVAPDEIADDPPARDEVAGGPLLRDEEVEISVGAASLAGRLALPERPIGIVLFAHASGNSRHSPRSRYVANILHEAGLGTLQCDLLTAGEQMNPANVFDIGLLAGRLLAATGWLRTRPDVAGLPVGYFGASTGGAAALWAAAEPGADIAAVASCGGRPDLASPRLGFVTAPTLLIVGERDNAAPGHNRRAQADLRCENHLAVVPGATLLFDEPGTLAVTAGLARDWFARHLAATPTSDSAAENGSGHASAG